MAFKKGKSGNPGGRPKEVEGLKRMIREKSKDGADFIKRLYTIADDAEEDRDKINAIKILLEYGFGKPSQDVDLHGTGEDGGVVIQVVTGVLKPDADDPKH